MPDMEKVVKGLEDIQKHLDTGYSFAISWESELIRDALSLLKEQDKIIQNILREKTNELNNKVTTLRIESQNQEMRRLLEQK